MPPDALASYMLPAVPTYVPNGCGTTFLLHVRIALRTPYTPSASARVKIKILSLERDFVAR